MIKPRKYVLTANDVHILNVSRSAGDLSVALAGAEAKLPPRVMKKALSRLESQGLVISGPDRTLIRLTDAGVRVQRLVRPKKSHRPSLLGRMTMGSMRLLSNLGLREVDPQVLLIPEAEEEVLNLSSEQINHALDEIIAQRR